MSVRLLSVCLPLQHHIQSGALEQGFSLLLQHIPQVSSRSAGLSSACVRPWLSLLVAAAAEQQTELHSQVTEVLGQWAEGHTQTIDTAWVSQPQRGQVGCCRAQCFLLYVRVCVCGVCMCIRHSKIYQHMRIQQA